MKCVDERAKAAQADQLVKATTHIEDQIGADLLRSWHTRKPRPFVRRPMLHWHDSTARAALKPSSVTKTIPVQFFWLSRGARHIRRHRCPAPRRGDRTARSDHIQPEVKSRSVTAVHDAVDADAAKRFTEERDACSHSDGGGRDSHRRRLAP